MTTYPSRPFGTVQSPTLSLLALADDFTAASLPPALCRVGSRCDIHLPGPLRASVRRRKATAVRRVLRGRSLCRLCSEAWKCERFLADHRHYPAGVSGLREVSRNR